MNLFPARPYFELWRETLAAPVLFLILAVTAVQALRLAWWAYRATADTAGASRRSARAGLIAQSTRGLARTAVWLTCAEGARRMQSAMNIIENSPTPGSVIVMRNYLDLLEATSIGLAWCALLFAVSFAFDLVAARVGRHAVPPVQGTGGDEPRLLRLLHWSPTVLGMIVLVLVSWLLLNLRPSSVVGSDRDPFFFDAWFKALAYLWPRLAYILAIVGVLSWLTTLLESALRRRRLPK